MPKTYNARQIADMKAQDAHAAPLPDTSDLTRHVRFFSSEEVAGLVERIESRVATDKPTHLKPDTSYLVARALRAWASRPTRREIVREICVVKNCSQHDSCMTCIGRANVIIGLFEDRKVRSEG